MFRHKLGVKGGILATMLIIAVMMVSTASAATLTAVIDFEGLSEGQIVSSVSSGNGISGDAIGGAVAVTGVRLRFGTGINAAMIFDATCTGGCTGSDNDLFQPGLGNVLIISEDLDSSDPDDADDAGSYFTFDFSGFGPGVVTVHDMTVVDIEEAENENAVIEAYSGGSLVATVAIPNTGSGQAATVAVNATNVDFLKVILDGSGAIDNVRVSIEEPDEPGPGTGTPGYWMNHPEAWPVESISIGGVVYSKAEAIAWMQAPVQGDKTKTMFSALVAAKLNVLIGNDDSCIADTISDADAWMVTNPVGSDVKANSDAWQNEGEALATTLDQYNNGLLCAPARD